MGQGEESWVARTCHGEIVQELPSRGIKDLHLVLIPTRDIERGAIGAER